MRRVVICSLAAFAVAVSPVASLTDEEIFREFRFNLINPGARSLAMGGAFISQADDATAAQANPAGLGTFRRPEYFVETRWVDNAGRASTRRDTIPPGIESFVAAGNDLDDVVSPSFIGVVQTYGRWAMGLSRQELLNIENTTISSFSFTIPDSPGVLLAEGAGVIDADVTNINVSAGVKINDYFSAGATLTFSQLNVTSEVVNTIVDTGPNVADMEILEPTLDLRTTIDDDDDEVVFGLGVLYKRQNWQAGAVYRKRPKFRLSQDIEAGVDVFEVVDTVGPRIANVFSLPDSYGVGASWRPKELLTLALDVERTLYSELLDGYVAGINVLTSSDAEFTVDDGTDVRFGAEYIFSDLTPILALRGGLFSESDSTIRASFVGSESFATEASFAGGDRELHATVGAGLVFGQDGRYKLDFAADFAEPDNEYLVSFIFQPKK